MAAQRNTNFSLDSDHPGPIRQELGEIDKRGRLHLPTQLIQSISWLKGASHSVDALAILEEPGRIKISDWNTASLPVLERRKELINDLNRRQDDDVIEALRLIEDRYKKIRIPSDLRPTINNYLMLHLELSPENESKIYIVSVSDNLIVMSSDYRNAKLLNFSTFLPDLP